MSCSQCPIRVAVYAGLLGLLVGVPLGAGLTSGGWAWLSSFSNAEPATSRPAAAARRGPALEQFDLDGLLEPRDRILAGGPHKDGIPAVVDPRLVAAADAGFLAPRDRVVAVSIDGDARAYPIRLLNYHEIVNDRVGGVPIAVVYCPLCDSVTVVDRRIDGDTLEFGVSGLLLHSNVLMYDRTHEALWTQVGARAISGPLAGRALAHLDGWEIAPFGAWSARHPRGRVASFETGHHRDYDRRPYERYFENDELAFPAPRDERLPRNKIPVVGVRVGASTCAVPVAAVARAPGGRLEVPVAGARVVLASEPGSREIAVVEAPEGAAVVHTFWFAWAAFHPDTAVVGADAVRDPRADAP